MLPSPSARQRRPATPPPTAPDEPPDASVRTPKRPLPTRTVQSACDTQHTPHQTHAAAALCASKQRQQAPAAWWVAPAGPVGCTSEQRAPEVPAGPGAACGSRPPSRTTWPRQARTVPRDVSPHASPSTFRIRLGARRGFVTRCWMLPDSPAHSATVQQLFRGGSDSRASSNRPARGPGSTRASPQR